ncbi:hypothetical protein SADUNF_Sadunf13G0026700 [Salix dunnii]|uniref:Transmembrane protein n=1 Tax=Salix dunnii TaxID=1413687 RepID=A0A835JIR8_9ROSI|nr:hypothetical protein SADUNF_Sadunf13G0026700 [Salix dunnii]
MAENHRPNPAFDKESIIMQHGIFTLLVETLKSLIQAKYQSINASPFDSHDVIMSVLLVAIFTYATASVAEVMLLARESPYCTLAGNLRLFAGALAAISLLSILDPILGFITSTVWACLFMAVAYKSRTEIHNILRPVSRNLTEIFTRETKQGRMAANPRPNLAFQKESIIMQHGVFTLLVETLNSLIQVKYHTIKASPFDSHNVIMSILLVALFLYATASVAEVMLLARESPYCTLVGNLRLFAGALAAISLLSILDPILGFTTSAVWACLFMAVAYESRTELGDILSLVTHKLIDIFTRLAASVRSREEQPHQPRV